MKAKHDFCGAGRQGPYSGGSEWYESFFETLLLVWFDSGSGGESAATKGFNLPD